ncbi:MAG: glycosyltransferase [Deltaproteobacteria bacterium]|nr:MAG: glycosyltransferase [Deltaproteobacteria bacterium]
MRKEEGWMAATEAEGNPLAGSGATAPPLKIAYVLPNIEAGGAEGHLLSLARRLDRSRFSPFLVTTAGGGSLYDSFRSLLPVSVIGDPRRARARPPKNPFVHLQAIRELATAFRAHSPDIVHNYLPAANVLGTFAARWAGIPRVVVSKRSLPDYKKGHPFLTRLESLGNRLSDVVMVNSDAVRREIGRTERFCEGKFRRIYNGVAPVEAWDPEQVESFRAREGLPPGSLVAACVSNFFEYKGHEDLVKAAARLAGELPELILVLIGRDAGSLEATRALARDLGVLERFRFPGARSDIPDFLRAADLFVHPSRQEGFSNAILEAMAAGLPVVACDVGGNPEAVVDGVTGRLVPPRDPTALAAAMAEILVDPGKGRSMGEAGRQRATDRFSLDRMVREIEGMYESLMLRGPAGN